MVVALRVDEVRAATSEPAFNLADEAWIQVVYPDGVRLVSLRELFADAHQIRDVVGATPMERWAIRHLLCAIAGDMPTSGDTNRFSASIVATYFDLVADRLWLIHPTDPFLQSPSLADRNGTRSKLQRDNGAMRVKVKSTRALVPTTPPETSAVWWDHSPEQVGGEWWTCDLATAARLVVTRALFATVGNTGGGSPAGQYTNSYQKRGVQLAARVGTTLAETLHANQTTRTSTGTAAFATADLASEAGAMRPAGDLSVFEQLMWSHAATLLIPDGDQVRFVLIGARCDLTAAQKDLRSGVARQIRALNPFMLVARTSPTTTFLYTDPARAPWRAMPALVETFANRVDGDSVLSAERLAHPEMGTPVETLGLLFRGTLHTPIIDGWVRSSLPASLANRVEFAEILAHDLTHDGVMGRAEAALRDAAYEAFQVERPSKSSPEQAPVESNRISDVLEEYWAHCERLVLQVAANESGPVDLPDTWADDVTAVARRVGDEMFNQLYSTAPHKILNTATARARLHGRLSRLS